MSESNFHPSVSRWLEQTFGAPTPCQIQAWSSIKAGKHTLVAAPTGSGKTLAAFLCAIDDLVHLSVTGVLEDSTAVLYVSPLKALSNDIEKNLNVPLESIHRSLSVEAVDYTPIRAAVRTGDTPQAARAAMRRRPPHILVTTPESLYILLTSESGREMLSGVRTVIIDEIHALAGNKRGAHLSLSLERLDYLTTGSPLRIGLSATQEPIDEIARFLVGMDNLEPCGAARCAIVNEGHVRDRDLGIELPAAPLEAVLSGDSAAENYDRIAELIRQHKTTLVFVNTRRMSERVARALSERVGEEFVTSHHGSMAKERRLEAEQRLKNGQLKALVATASLELGIDIGDIELVCQIGSTRTLSMFLQRVGRSGHSIGAVAKGRLFPQTRDQLVECAALLDMTRRGELDRITVRQAPLDVLAQQIVAEVSSTDWSADKLYRLCVRAYGYRALTREKFDEVIKMLSEGYSFARGRSGAYLHWDAINGNLRARRGARLTALTNGGAIPDNADYDVIVEPSGHFVGSVNEDFAIESLPGNVFQLGNTSWRVLRVDAAALRVVDAAGEPPNMPFWLGEAPARSAELSFAVSRVRDLFRERADGAPGDPREAIVPWLSNDVGVGEYAAQQLFDYLMSGYRALGTMPTQDVLVMERFFDESGGMQLVIHSSFGSAVNRAWGLALRKRFCRTFNFELQAAAIEDAIVISLGAVHSFPLEEVWRYLNSATVRDVLTQAVLDVPMFNIRWRWVANCALALPRFRGGKKVPPRLQRMNAEDLAALLFPDQLACAENLHGSREIPEHPLVEQALRDCLTEAMDIDTLENLLAEIADGKKQLVQLDLTEPSPFAHEILNANPYAFLDDAPLEERRTQAVQSRRWLDPDTASDLGALDIAAIERVCDELAPGAINADELHEALLLMGAITEEEAGLYGRGSWDPLFDELSSTGRAVQIQSPTCPTLWVASERYAELHLLWSDRHVIPGRENPALKIFSALSVEQALVALVRSRLDNTGPQTDTSIARILGASLLSVKSALTALENRGVVFQGRFTPEVTAKEWCDRRVLARIHRYTLRRLRAEIEPVSGSIYLRFLFEWQRVAPQTQSEGLESTAAIIEQLAGFEVAAVAWESEILPARVRDFRPDYLDQLHSSGRTVWLRLNPKRYTTGTSVGPLKSTPIALIPRNDLRNWLAMVDSPEEHHEDHFSGVAKMVLTVLTERGAAFFDDIVDRCGVLKSQCELALGELAAAGLITADSFSGLRILLVPASKRRPLNGSRRRGTPVASVDTVGRWDLIPRTGSNDATRFDSDGPTMERIVGTLLNRYGIVFKRVIERETALPPWRYLLWALRRMEARGEVRGGRFVAGFSGEQFGLPDAVDALRRMNKSPNNNEIVVISGTDPLNLAGVITPGLRIPATTKNQIAYLDGEPVAVRIGQDFRMLKECTNGVELRVRTALIRQPRPTNRRSSSRR
ncbi:MAG: ATP-dependent Lhr-like helicase [Gammaproteobacteria bacterium]|jgi:ATP-dependent Lhr-like helicase